MSPSGKPASFRTHRRDTTQRAAACCQPEARGPPPGSTAGLRPAFSDPGQDTPVGPPISVFLLDDHEVVPSAASAPCWRPSLASP